MKRIGAILAVLSAFLGLGTPEPVLAQSKSRSLSCLMDALRLESERAQPSAPTAPPKLTTPATLPRASLARVERLESETRSRLAQLSLGGKIVEVPPSGAARSSGVLPRTPRAMLPSAGAPSQMNPQGIRFMQDSISNQALDKDYSVLQNALDLRSGKLKPGELPAIRIWKDEFGRVWTLDHRRLASFVLAGNITDIPVHWVGPADVRAQAFKFTTENEGKSVLMKLGRGLGVVIP